MYKYSLGITFMRESVAMTSKIVHPRGYVKPYVTFPCHKLNIKMILIKSFLTNIYKNKYLVAYLLVNFCYKN